MTFVDITLVGTWDDVYFELVHDNSKVKSNRRLFCNADVTYHSNAYLAPSTCNFTPYGKGKGFCNAHTKDVMKHNYLVSSSLHNTNTEVFEVKKILLILLLSRMAFIPLKPNLLKQLVWQSLENTILRG